MIDNGPAVDAAIVGTISRKESLFGSTVFITAASLVGLGAGFFFNLVLAWLFGAGAHMDAYWAAASAPDLFNTVLIGSLQITLIPVFIQYIVQQGEEEAWKVASSLCNLVVLLLVGVASLGVVFAPAIMHVLVPGFDQARMELATSVLRVQFPTIIFSGLAGLLGSIHYARRSFVIPSTAPLLESAVRIAFVVLMGRSLGVLSIAWGALLGAFVNCAFQISIWLRPGRFWAIIDWRHPGVKRTMHLIIPWLLGMMVAKADPLISRFLASGLPEGSISYLGYADKLRWIVALIGSSGLAISLFPLMSEQASKGDPEVLGRTLIRGLRWITYIVTPMIAALIALRVPIIQTLFERGNFSHEDTIATGIALMGYSLGILTGSLGNVNTRTFYALQDTRTPAFTAVIVTILYVPMAWALSGPLSFLGITLALSMRSVLNQSWQLWILSRRLKGVAMGKFMWFLLRIAAASAVAGIFLWIVDIAVDLIKLAVLYRVLWMALMGGLGALLYLLLTRYVANDEWQELVSLVRGSVRRAGRGAAILLGSR